MGAIVLQTDAASCRVVTRGDSDARVCVTFVTSRDSVGSCGAGGGIRTLDILLGKQTVCRFFLILLVSPDC